MRKCLSDRRCGWRSTVAGFESCASKRWLWSLMAADEMVSLTQDDDVWIEIGGSGVWKGVSGKVVRWKVVTEQVAIKKYSRVPLLTATSRSLISRQCHHTLYQIAIVGLLQYRQLASHNRLNGNPTQDGGQQYTLWLQRSHTGGPRYVVPFIAVELEPHYCSVASPPFRVECQCCSF